MAFPLPDPALERIERALARIERAAAARAFAADTIARRHAMLRTHMEGAVAALDTVLAREDAPDAPAR